MKRITKLFTALALALGLTTAASAAEMKTSPVFLLNYQNSSSAEVSGWTNKKQEGGGDLAEVSDGKGHSFKTSANKGGNFKASFSAASSDSFQTGTYTDVFGTSHTSLLEEIKTSLSLDSDITADIYNAGVSQGARTQIPGQLSGLTPGKKYVIFVGFGKTSVTQGSTPCRPAFKLTSSGCGTKESLDYVVTQGSDGADATTADTKYTAFNIDQLVGPKAGSLMIVRFVGTPNSDGKFIFDLGGDLVDYWRSGLNFLAVAQVITIHEASVSTDTDWSEISWTPAIEDPASAVLNLTVTDGAKIRLDTTPVFAALNITGTMTIDANGVTGEDVAKNAVVGAPYSYWFFTATGTVTGSVALDPSVVLPNGYAGTTQNVAGYGTRLVVTAPEAAKFGSVNINFAGGRSSSLANDSKVGSLTTLIGAQPIMGTSWNDLGAENQTDTTVPKYVKADGTVVTDAGIKLTASQVNNSYTSGAAANMLITGYMDDSKSPIVQISNIPFSKYRVILYRATDQGSATFSAAQIGTTSSDAKIYYGPTSGSETGGTTLNGTTETVWGKSDWRSGYAESVNYIVSDVLEGTAGSATAYIYSHKHAGRAGVAAIQIVEVGKAITTVDYKATIEEEGEWALSALDWDTKPFAPTDKDTVTITVADDVAATVNVDVEDLAVSTFATATGDGAALTLAGNAFTANVIDDSASTGATTIDINPGALPIKAGADTILSVAGTGNYTIAADKKLTVKSGSLSDSQVSNSGTLNFSGGTEDDPIVFTMNGAATKVTLDADTYVKVTPSGNKVYNVTGTDETSVFEIARDDDGTGCSSGAKFRNLTLVANVTKDGKYFWLEHGPTDATVKYVSKANGTYLNGATTVGALAGSGYIYKYGDASVLTIAPAYDADFSGGAGVNVIIAEGDAVQTLSGAFTQTLTVNEGGQVKLTGNAQPKSIAVEGTVYVDPNGAAKTITGTITGAGNIIVHDYSEGANGSVAFTGDLTGFTGTITYENGSYNIGTARTKPELPSYIVLGEDVTFAAMQSSAEYAQGLASEFSEFTEGDVITLNKLDGTVQTLVADAEGKAASEASGEIHIDGPATYADATFTNATSSGAAHIGTLSYKAYDGLKLQYDSAVTTNAAGTGVYLKHHPWIEGFPSSFFEGGDLTIAVVGEMSTSNNTAFVHLGSSTYSNTGVLLATGTKEDEVVVKVNTGTSLQEITTMTVPHAATARHVYVITKSDTETESVFSVYLDGTPWKTVKLDKKSFTGGVQCGSDFGGELHRANPPVVEDVKDDDTALINVLRVYDRVISKDEIDLYSDTYPYVSASGTSSRTFTGEEEDWIAEESATCWSFKKTAESEAVLTNAPVASSTIEINGTADVTTTVNVNLDEDAHQDAVSISSPGAFKFAKVAGKEGLIISGQTTIGCPVEIQYKSLDISGAPLTLIDEGAITFDLSDFDLSTYFAGATIPMTGDVAQDDEKITAINIPVSEGREATFGYNGTQYVLTITVEDHPFVYNMGWTWNDDPVDVAIVSNNTAQAIIVQSNLEWPIDRASITNEAGTLTVTAVTKRAADVTVEEGAVLDLNGNQAKEMALTLNGGKVTYGNTKLGEADQIKELTLTADSEINTTVKGQIYAASYNTATTIALDTYTLAKTGTDILQVVNTDITGTGTIDIQEGEFYGSEDTRATNVTFKIAEGATLHNRGGKTMTIAKIVGEGGTLNNEGTMPAFAISGTLNIANAGTFQTNMLVGATVNIGQKRGLVFSGAGTVNAVLTAAEIAQEGPVTIFEVEEGLTSITGGTVVDKAGNEVPGNWAGGSFQVSHGAKIGDVYYLTLQDALNAGGDVVMLKDVAKEVTIPAGKTVNLDFNGCAITTTSRQAINNHGTLTIANGNITAQESAIVLWGNSTTTISGGAYTAKDNAVIMGSGNEGEGNVTLTITGGTFNGNIASAGYIACGIYVPNSGTYTISGGQFNITGGCGICARAGEIKVASEAEFNLGGETTPGKVGDSARLVPCVAMYTDYEAGYPGHVETDYLKAKDNTLTTAETQTWFGPDEEDYYTLGQISDAEAKIGDTYYLTLAGAFAAAKDGETIVVQKDCTVAERINIDPTKDITLDANAKKITIAEGIYAFVNGGATETTGEGTLTVTGNGTFYAPTADSTCFLWARRGNIVVESGSFSMDGTAQCVYADNGCKATINGGTFVNRTGSDVLNVHNSRSAVTDIQCFGGSYSRDPALGDDALGGTFVAAGYVSTLNASTGLYDVTEQTGPQPAPGSQTEVDPVGENTYVVTPTGTATDLAVQGAKDGDTFIINGTSVTTLTLDRKENVTVEVMNGNGNVPITGAVYGWDKPPVLKLSTSSVNETYTFSTELDPTKVNLAVNGITVGANVDVAVTSFVGLTYTLVRSETIGGTETVVTESAQVAAAATTTLTDTGKPAGQAFYKVKVTK